MSPSERTGLQDQPRVAAPALVILTPVCDDWRSLRLLLPKLDAALAEAGLAAEVVVVDDGSNEPRPPDLAPAEATAISRIRLVSLARNLGHQRAIAIGLAWVQARLPCSAVVVMDGDGEDAPSDIPRLVAASRENGDRAVVFAQRARRSEGLVFRFANGLYRIAHRLLVGRGIRFGNFSIYGLVSGQYGSPLCSSGVTTLTSARRPGEVGLTLTSGMTRFPSYSVAAKLISWPSARRT